MSIVTEWVKKINWVIIYHKDEHEDNGELIFTEIIEEASYRGGYLIRDTYLDYTQGTESGVRTSSITFIPSKRAKKIN